MKVTSNLHVLYLAAAIMLSLSTLASANDDWPQWRGPQRNDQSTETGLLKTWPEAGPKQLWVNSNSGLGYAGFSVADGKLFTLGLDGDDEFALCLDADSGKEIWRTVIGKKYRNGWGDGPTQHAFG